MSFAHWGSTRYSERKTDWKTNPASFMNIVEAISKCGLKTSLKTIDIKCNQTLNNEEVLEVFNQLEMFHIKIIEEGPAPSD